MHFRVYKGVENLFYFAAAENAGTDFGKPVRLGIQAGRLRVKGDILGINREAAAPRHGIGAVHIIDIIGFKAIENLDTVLFACLPHIRESLRHTMVRHCDGGHAPVCRTLNNGGRVRQSIKGGKARMQMQLHAFDLRVVRPHRLLSFQDAARVHHHIVIIFGIGNITANRQMVANRYGVND